MDDRKPVISVLMPVFNAAPFLREAIESILHQTFSGFEFIIINDGSTDSSKEIILSFQDPRIRYIENETNLKLIATLNKGINLCSGKYIARMDADDISLPDRLKLQVEFMESNPEIALCGTGFQIMGRSDQISGFAANNDEIRIRMLHQVQLLHPSVLLRRESLLQKNIMFDPDYIHAEDYDFFVRIAENYKVANIPGVLVKYRVHDANISNIHGEIQNENTKKVIIRQFRKLKDDFTADDCELYLKFAYSEFPWFDKQKVEYLDKLLTLLQSENERKLYLPVIQLKEYWSDKLFHICYNVPECMDIWRHSVFYEKGKMTLLKSIKKYIKR